MSPNIDGRALAILFCFFAVYSVTIFLIGRAFGARKHNGGSRAISEGAQYKLGRATERIEQSVDSLRTEIELTKDRSGECLDSLSEGVEQVGARVQSALDLIRSLRGTKCNADRSDLL